MTRHRQERPDPVATREGEGAEAGGVSAVKRHGFRKNRLRTTREESGTAPGFRAEKLEDGVPWLDSESPRKRRARWGQTAGAPVWRRYRE